MKLNQGKVNGGRLIISSSIFTNTYTILTGLNDNELLHKDTCIEI